MNNSRWIEAPLEDIIERFIDFRGRTPKKLSMEWGGDIPALSANNVQMGKINLEKGTQYGSESLYRRWMSLGDCAKGDIVLTMEAPLGNVAQIPDNQKYLLSQRVILLKTNKQLIDNDFLFQRLSWENFQATLKEYATGTTAQGIQRAKLEKIPITFPPLKEQTRIAAVLSCIDRAIEHTEKLIAKQQRIKHGLLQDLLTKGIDEHGIIRSEATHEFKDSPLGRIPKEWKAVQVGNVFDMILGKMLNKEAKGGDNQFPYLANRNVLWDSVDLSDLDTMNFSDYERQKLELKFGDLLICEGGAVGRTAMWRDEMSDCYFQKAIHRLRANRDFIIPEFMLNFMKLADEKGLFTDLTSQTSIAHLTQEKLMLLQIPLPSIEEQRQIVMAFEQSRNLLLSEEYKLKKLHKLKKGLMQDLLTGKVRVSGDLLTHGGSE